MQKALWVGKNNPNKAKLIAALKQVATNPESVGAVEKKVGKYQWLIGNAGDAHRDTLMKLITPEALSTLVKFNNEAFGIKAVYKDTLIAQK
jgi:predicted lipid-binding transport protein (Tim44 family)